MQRTFKEICKCDSFYSFIAKSIELQTISAIKPKDDQHTNGVNNQALLFDKSTNENEECETNPTLLKCSVFRYGRRDTPKSPSNIPCEIGNILCQLWYKKQGLLLTQESVLQEAPLWSSNWQVAKKSTRKVERKLETKSIEAVHNANNDTGCDASNPTCRWMSGKRARKAHRKNGIGKVSMRDNSEDDMPCSKKNALTCGVFYGKRNVIPADTQASQVNNNSSKNTSKGGSTITPGLVITRESIASPTANNSLAVPSTPLLETYTEQPNVTRCSMQKIRPKCDYRRNPNCRMRLFIGK